MSGCGGTRGKPSQTVIHAKKNAHTKDDSPKSTMFHTNIDIQINPGSNFNEKR